MSRLERLVAMALVLGSRRRVVARSLADEFGTSLRTIYRDVKTLADAGFPVEGSAGDGYRVSAGAFLRPLAFVPDEAEALAVAAHALGAQVEGTMRASLAGAVAKLEAVLDGPARDRIVALRGRVVVPGGVRHGAPTAAMLEAIRLRRVCRLAYVDPRVDPRSGAAAGTEGDVEPLGLVCGGDAWWLVGWCRLRGDARAFRVDAVEAFETTDEVFAPRDGASFRDVVVRDAHLAADLFGRPDPARGSAS